jgi:hypothetical protein
MEELDLTRWVIVTSNHGEKYVGRLPEGENGTEYFNTAAQDRMPVRLHGARLMLSQHGAGPEGLASGIQTMVAFIPIDLADGPLEEINVVPSSWYFPPTDPGVIDKFTRLLKAAEEAEENNRQRMSAARAGISIPGVRRGTVER